MRQVVVALLLVSLTLMMFPGRAEAYENDVQEVLQSSFYGGLTGALIGAAFLAFRDEPGDHLEDISVGAGVGVILGTLYGIGKTTRAFVEVQDGALAFQLPSLQLDVNPAQHDIRGSLELIHVPF